MAAQTLSDENLRLQEEIRRVEKGDATIEEGIAHHGVEGDEIAVEQDPHAAQQAQDSHSRTILAALMSGVDEAFPDPPEETDTDETAWMQGVESLFKDAESEGRLGELASVAAGQGEDPAAASAMNTAPPQEDVQSLREAEEPVTRPSTISNSASIAAVTSHTVAVVINAEMEKQLRNDLASTKAAIAQIEQEMGRFRGGAPIMTEIDTQSVESSPLPQGILSPDAETLRAKSTEMVKLIESLEAEMPGRRERVLRMRDDRVEDEIKLAGTVSELQALGLDSGEVEKVKIDTILAAIGGLVGNMLGDLQGGLSIDVSGVLHSSFIAIADGPPDPR